MDAINSLTTRVKKVKDELKAELDRTTELLQMEELQAWYRTESLRNQVEHISPIIEQGTKEVEGLLASIREKAAKAD